MKVIQLPVKMAPYDGNLTWSEVRDIFRQWREDNERKSREIVEMWEMTLQSRIHKLGDERLLVLEQVCIAGMDSGRLDVADFCLHSLAQEMPTSLRVRRLQAMKLEAMEKYDEALALLDSIIKRDETNAAPRKRKIAILKAQGRNVETIKELTEYLKRFMSDQEAWQELSELYLNELEFARAAFCLEELLLHAPHSHLLHQRYAEIRYTQGGADNMELARAHFSQALKLNPNNLRALYGIYLAASNIAQSTKSAAPKKKDSAKLATWALKQIQERYCQLGVGIAPASVGALEGIMGQLQITT